LAAKEARSQCGTDQKRERKQATERATNAKGASESKHAARGKRRVQPHENEQADSPAEHQQIRGWVKYRRLEIGQKRTPQTYVRIPEGQPKFENRIPEELHVGPVKQDIIDTFENR